MLERLRGRVMSIFQLANQGLNPLGQVETGLVVPLIGAPSGNFRRSCNRVGRYARDSFPNS